MKTNFYSVAVATVLAGWLGLASPLFGQVPGTGAPPFNQPPAASAPTGAQPSGVNPAARAGATPTQIGVNGMAVVDVAYIFKKYPKFEQAMNGMKVKVEAAENDVKKEQEGLKGMADQLKQYNPTSPEYKNLEAAALKRSGELNVKVQMQKKDFMEQEGRIYFNISREIDDAVKLLAQRYNIVLVLRFNGDPVDPNDRNEILRGINKPIVFYDPRMDITPFILQDLTRSSGGTGNIGVRPQTPGAVQPR